MGVCGYCGAENTAKHGQRDNQVHKDNCPFVPESERQLRLRVRELEERVKNIEDTFWPTGI